MRQQNRAIISHLEGWLALNGNQVENNARMLRTSNISIDRMISHFIEQAEAMDDVSAVFVGFPDGNIVFGGGWDVSENLYAPDRVWYIEALEKPGEIVFSRPYIGAATQQLTFAVARTVSNDDDSLGITAISLPFAAVANHILQKGDTSESFSFILDQFGDVLYHPDPAFAPINESTFQNKNEVSDGRYLEMFEAIKNEGFYVNTTTIHVGSVLEATGWYVITRIPTSYVMKNTLPTVLVLIAATFLALATLTGALLMLRKIKLFMESEREANAMNEKLIDSAPFIMNIWDSNNEIMMTNQQAAKTFGFNEKAEYIAHFFRLSPERQPCGMPSIEKAVYYLNEAFSDDRPVKFEWMHQTLAGELVPSEITLIRFLRSGKYLLAAYAIDLRPIREALENEQAAKEENQAKTRFLARMSHEVRTPMNAILGITEIELQKNIHTPKTVEAFQRIFNSSKLLLSIINDILDLTKVEAGKMEIVPAVYETVSFIADAVQLNLMYIGSKQINFRLEIGARLPLYLIGDELRLKQILNNLLSNAFKYTPEGEVILGFEIEQALNAEDAALIISVTDTGQGMNTEQIEKMFGSEFTRFNLEQNREIEGSGLGMSITHALVKMMGGTINVESTPGSGSTFTVRVPQKIEGSEIISKETIENLKNFDTSKAYLRRTILKTFEPMPYGHVLVVDDVETNLYVVEGILMPYEIKVELVKSGMEAISRIKNGQVYDIIFMDHMMPGMDGIEAVKIIRGMGYTRPIIALTANATIGASEMFMNSGFSGFISKPIEPSKMDECLMNFVFDKYSADAATSAKDKIIVNKGNSRSVTDKLVKSFLVDAAKSIAILEPLAQMLTLDNDNLKAYIIQTHGMRSVLHNIGNNLLSEIAGSLEIAGRNNDMDVIRNETIPFLENVQQVIQSYTEFEGKDNLEVVEDSVSISEQLTAISEACEAYDIVNSKGLVRTLKQSALSAETTKLIDKIEMCLMVSDYDEAALLAKQALKNFVIKED